MSTYDHGPLRTYEVIWRSGHVEQVQAHQVLLPPQPSMFSFGTPEPRHNRLTIHGEIDGRWGLILDVDYADILSVRLIPEPVRGPVGVGE